MGEVWPAASPVNKLRISLVYPVGFPNVPRMYSVCSPSLGTGPDAVLGSDPRIKPEPTTWTGPASEVTVEMSRRPVICSLLAVS